MTSGIYGYWDTLKDEIVYVFKLKQKVLAKGLPWKITDESLANQIIQNELGVQS